MSSNLDIQSSTRVPIFSFGDGWVPDLSTSRFTFPSRHEAKCLVDRYYDFAMPTYRFLHRDTVNGWLEVMCTEHESSNMGSKPLSSSRRAIVILALATAKLYGEGEVGSLQDDGEDTDCEER